MAQQNTTQEHFSLHDFMAQWPYERRLHSTTGVVDVASGDWVNGHGFFDEENQKSFEASLFGRLGCLIYPTASDDFCRAGCDLVHLYFVIDEHNDVAGSEEAARVRDLVMDVLRNPNKERKSEDKLGIFTQQFWQRALKLTKPGAACIQRFVDNFELYMESMVQEAKDREAKRIRSVDDYLQLRRQTHAAQATISFIGFEVDIPEYVHSDPAMQSIVLAASDLLCISNDIHSYPIELARGLASHNIVSSVMQEYKLSVHDAIGWVDNFGDDKVKAFIESKDSKLPSWGPETDQKVREYIDRIGYVVRGADEWSYESERYWEKNGQEVRETRKGRILPENSKTGLLTKEDLKAVIV